MTSGKQRRAQLDARRHARVRCRGKRGLVVNHSALAPHNGGDQLDFVIRGR
jgi:hypothetical protein